MTLDDLKIKYDKMQKKYGDPNLDSVSNGGCIDQPDLCLVFMNPTGRNIATSKEWKGRKSPWLGTKNIWDLFDAANLISKDIYEKIRSYKPRDWTEDFCEEVYEDVAKHKVFITNLGKCTQIDARPLSDSVYLEYLDLLYKEFEIIKPKVIVLFGNQVSSIVLKENISVSTVRKKEFKRRIGKNEYTLYSLFYPIGNGRFNIDKTIEDLNYIIETKIKAESTDLVSSL